MRKLFILILLALFSSMLMGGIKKTLYRDYGIVVFHPDSLISVRAHQIVWGNFWVIQSDSTDTMSMTPDKMTIDSITITNYLHSTDDVQFDSTLTFGSGAVFSQPHADTIILTEGNIILTGKIRAGSFGTPLDVTSNRVYGAELHYYGNNYNVTALRARAQFKTTDATGDTAIGALIQAANNDGINASVLNGAKIEAIGKATTTGARIGTMRGLLVNTEWSAKDTITDLRILHLRTHTRDATADGCVDGTSYGLYIENEAVGGNGQALDAGIYLDGTNLSAGNKAFTYGADFSGVATDIGTADFRFRSGGLIDNPVDTFRITEAKLDLIGDALLDDVTIDSALTVEGKAVFNDTVMLGDSADKMILPKGSSIELFDTTDTDKFEIYDDGTHSVFASVNPFIVNNNVWIPGDTLFFTDGGADTSWIVQTGNYFEFGGDNSLNIKKHIYSDQDMVGTNDVAIIRWNGWRLELDVDNDNAIAFISFHNEDSIKVDTTGATGHRLSWTGAGGMEIWDGTGADSARWYDDGTSTIFTTDNDFVLSDDVTLGDTINTVFLPKGTRLVLADTSGADSTVFHNDGVKLSIISDNKIELGGNNIYLGSGDTLYFISATPDTFFITNQGGQARIAKLGGNLGIDASVVLSGSLQVFGNATLFDTYCREWRIDSNSDDSLALITWFATDSLRADTISYQLEWTGSGGIKSIGADFTGNLWMLGDTLFFTDGSADTNYIVNTGTYLYIGGDNNIHLDKPIIISGTITGNTEADINWDGWKWKLDVDNDDALALISFHNEDSIKVDTSTHVLEWTGSGGIHGDKFSSGKGSDIASATTITVTHGIHDITGTTSIDSVVPGEEGQILILQFDGTAGSTGVVDGKNLRLAGNFIYKPNNVLTLFHSGNLWFEISRSDN